MGSKRRGKFSRWLKGLIVLGLVCLVGAILGIYLARIQIAQYFAEKAIAQTDIVESRFQWDRLDADVSSLSDVFIRSDSYTLAIEQIDLSYDLKEVWKERKLKTLKLKGLQLFYDLTGPSTVDLQEVDTLIKTGLPFPLYSVAIENSTVTLLTDFGESNIDLDIDLSQGEASKIQGQIRAKTANESLDLEIEISDRIRVTAQASTLDLEKTLTTNGIGWRDTLPFNREDALTLSDASLEARVTFNGLTLETATVSARTGPLSLRDFEAEAEIDHIEASFELSGTEIRNAASSVFLKKFSRDPLIVYESIIQIAVPELNEISITVPNTRWESTHGEKGTVSAKIYPALDGHYAMESYSGELAFPELYSPAFRMLPFAIAFDGNLESATFSCNKLVNQAMPWLAIEGMSTSIKGLDSEVPEIETAARIIAEASSSSEEKAPLTGAWDLTVDFSPEANPKTARLTLSPVENRSIFSSTLATLEGDASLQADFTYWSENGEAALKIGASGSDLATHFEDWSLQGGATSIALSTQPINLVQLGNLRNDTAALIELALPLTDFEISLQGSEIRGPSDLSLQWFSGTVRSAVSEASPAAVPPIQSRLEFGAGIVQWGSEVINQFSLNSEFSGSYDFLNTETNANLLFENEPVSIQLVQSFENIGAELTSKGRYAVEGINLLSSDILSRHLPELKGSALSANVKLQGESRLADHSWDASTEIQIREGSFRLPSQELSVDSIQADIRFPSLVNLSTDPSQTISAERITIGDIEATQLQTQFMLKNGNRLSVEKAALSIYDGAVSVDPFNLSLEKPNADLLIRFNRLSITPAMALLDFFDGQVSGRLNGALPIRIEKGYPILGEGFLELDPTEPAQFSYNANGFFTGKGNQTAAKKTLGDQVLERLGLEPNALLEDALGNLSIQTLRLDLFNKNLPETPMRIQLAGIANTGKAKIPLNITTNVNGTVAELLNFLTRLDSLGLVAGQTPAQPGTSNSNNL